MSSRHRERTAAARVAISERAIEWCYRRWRKMRTLRDCFVALLLAMTRSGTSFTLFRAMRHRVTCVALLLAVTAGPAHAANFSFAAFGDVPYNADEELRFINLIAQMNGQPLALAIHVGDFKDARQACTDQLFRERRDWFQLSHHPFVFIPGDNEWSDCWRGVGARREPLERLAKLRELFFAGDTALGQRSLRVQKQAARGYPEHLRWVTEDVLFLTLNIPGPNNNARMPKEARQRTTAVVEWLQEGFRAARERKLGAVVVATQANLWSGSAAFDEIVDTIAHEAQAFSGEVLVIHGDTHWYRFDQPLVDRKSGNSIANVSRLEVMGSPFFDWVYVTARNEGGRVRFSVQRGSDVVTRGR